MFMVVVCEGSGYRTVGVVSIPMAVERDCIASGHMYLTV